MLHIYVKLERDEDGYPPYEVEELDALELDEGMCRIVGIPVFARGLAVDDVVAVTRLETDGTLWATTVEAPSGHWTARVVPWIAGPADAATVVATFLRAGCRAHATPFGPVAVDVPPTVPANRVMDLLEGGRIHGDWDFDIGVGPAV